MKKLTIAAAALVALGAFSPAIADDGAEQSCGQDTHKAAEGTAVPGGSTVYETENGGVGSTNPDRGWIQADPETGVRGSTTDGAVNGYASADEGICLNGTTAP